MVPLLPELLPLSCSPLSVLMRPLWVWVGWNPDWTGPALALALISHGRALTGASGKYWLLLFDNER